MARCVSGRLLAQPVAAGWLSGRPVRLPVRPALSCLSSRPPQPQPPTPARSPNKMAATPSAEWGRLKWRRCNDVRRRAHAQLGAGRFALRLRGGGAGGPGKAGHLAVAPPRGRGGGGARRPGLARSTCKSAALGSVRAQSSPLPGGKRSASSRACPPPRRTQPAENSLPGICIGLFRAAGPATSRAQRAAQCGAAVAPADPGVRAGSAPPLPRPAPALRGLVFAPLPDLA